MGSPTYSNDSNLGWVVQKFGGTSVGKFPAKVSRMHHPANILLDEEAAADFRYSQIARDIVKYVVPHVLVLSHAAR